MRVLITGSRDYNRPTVMEAILNGLYQDHGDELYIIVGDARGADTIAADWVRKTFKVSFNHMWIYDAKWSDYGKAAGHIRNKEMLDEGKPDLVLAFKDNFRHDLSKGGTEDMCKQAAEAGVPVYLIERITVD